jgi:predicted nucleic acid-binding protein
MSRPVFDTNVFLTYRAAISDSDLARMALSIGALYELTATTVDRSEWQRDEALRRQARSDNLLLVPTMEDWWETAKLVARVRYGAKAAARGLTPKDPAAHLLQNDALIARTAYLAKFYVVTANIANFRKIQRFLDVEVVAAQDYFGF